MFQMLGMTEAGRGGCVEEGGGRRGSGKHIEGFPEPDSFKRLRSAWQLSTFSIWVLLEVLRVGRACSRWEFHSFSWLVFARLPGFLDAEPGAGSRALSSSFTLWRIAEPLLFAGYCSGR